MTVTMDQGPGTGQPRDVKRRAEAQAAVHAGTLAFWCDVLALEERQRSQVLHLLDDLAR
jgi:hypothetical protein